MRGPDEAYGAARDAEGAYESFRQILLIGLCLRASYESSSTDVGKAATRSRCASAAFASTIAGTSLRPRCAMPGTDLAYGATRFMTGSANPYTQVRYCPSAWYHLPTRALCDVRY
eukprot:1743623-Rhodomonas_salina.2